MSLHSTPATAVQNASSQMAPPKLDNDDLIKGSVLVVMAVLSLAGNTTTLATVCRLPGRATNVRILIGNLCVADLFVTVFCMVVDASWAFTITWDAGNVACKLLKYLQVLSLYASTYVLVAIAVDRFTAVLMPMSIMMNPRRLKVMLTVVWVSSAVLALPQLYLFRVMRAPFDHTFHQCVTHGAYTAAWQEQTYTIASFVALFLLPLAIIIVAYTIIFYTIATKARQSVTGEEKELTSQVGKTTEDVRSALYRRAKHSSLVMTGVILSAFIVCWLPYYIVMIGYVFNLDLIRKNESRVHVAVFTFGMLESMVNPLIYGVFHLASCRKRTAAAVAATSVRLTARTDMADAADANTPNTMTVL